MAALVNQAEKPNRVVPHLVIDVEGKRFGASARKAVGADMISAAPPNDFTRLPGNPFAEFARQPVGDDAVLGFGFRQVSLETGAENRFHAGDLKT